MAVRGKGKRVVMHIPLLPIGGGESNFVIVANALFARGYDVQVVMIAKEGDFIARLNPEIPITAVNSVYKTVAPGDYKRLRDAIQKLAPAVVISYMSRGSLMCCRMKKTGELKVPLLVCIQNAVSQEANVPMWKPHHWLVKLFRKFAPYADKVLCVSDDLLTDFAEHIKMPAGKLEVLYNPTVSANFPERLAKAPSHPWLVEKTIPTIVTAGRLAPQKDHAMLLSAFAKLRARMECRLIIFGEGVLRPELEKQRAELGLVESVQMPGTVPDVVPELAASDLFVLSSQFEGLPGVLVEAVACQRPCVSTDCKTGPREILQGGKYGALTPVGDADAFAGAMESMLKRPVFPPPEASSKYRESVVVDGWCALIEAGSRL